MEISFITVRHAKINILYSTSSFPVELFTLSEQNGVCLRSTISEFCPVSLSRILNLNYTQADLLSAIFKYCDDNKIALLNLKDI